MNGHAYMTGQISGQVTSQPAPQVSGTSQQFANSLASQTQNLGPQSMDQNLIAYRKAMIEKIYNFIQRNISSDEFLRKAPDIARRLEERLFNEITSMDDYINMVLDPAERQLQIYVKRAFAPKQPPSHHIASSSAHSTMIPAPGMSHNGIVGTAFPGSVENRSVTINGTGVSFLTAASMGSSQQTVNGATDVGTNSSFKTSDGLVSNSYQQTSNYAFSSSGGGLLPPVATTNMPRQLSQMIPTPGLGNQQSMPAISEFSSGANYSSNDSTMAITAEQQNKHVGVQNDNIVHSFGVQVGAGIRSNMTHKSSSYGLSNGIKNNSIGLVANNTQLTGAATTEGIMGNSSYGGSLKPVHQHFGQQQQQRVPRDSYQLKSSNLSSSDNFNNPGSSVLSSFNNLSATNMNTKLRTSSGLLNTPSSLQSMQCSPHIQNQVLDYQNKMNIQSARPMNEHLRQSQLQAQQSAQLSNQAYTQFGQNHHQLQRQQQSLQNQQFMLKNDMLTQATMPSGFGEDTVAGDTIVTHSESLISQTQQVQHSDFQSHYRQNNSFMDHARSAQALDHVSGFHVPVSQGSGVVLQQSHQQFSEFTTKVSNLSDQTQIEGFAQVQVINQPPATVRILESHGGDQQLQEVLHQRIKGQNVAHQPYISAEGLISSSAIAPKISTVSDGTAKSAQELDYRNQCKWLLFLWHARSCLAPKGQCLEVNCITVQDLLAHMRNCSSDMCIYPRCFKSNKLLKHYNTCEVSECPVCAPVRDHLSNQMAYGRALHGSNFISQVKSDPDRMKVDTDSVEDYDNKQALPKRLRIEDTLPALSNCESSPVSVPPVNELNVFKEEHLHDCDEDHTNISMEFKATNIMINDSTDPGQENITNLGDSIVSVDSDVPNYVDTSIKQEILAVGSCKDRENIQAKLEVSDPPADQATSSKSGKPKIKGVSLTELFTSEQIREHISSLRQWVGQGKAKAEKNQAMEHSMTENSCQLCAVEKLNFDPPPIYCSLCGARIKRNAMYYTIGSGDTRNFFCIPCYNEVRGDSIEVDGSTFRKAKMEKKRNDEETEEWWVQCDKCEAWQHQICGLFNGRRNDGGQAEYTCPNCYIVELESGERKPLPQSAVLGAKDLPRTILSDHIEQRLFRRLRHERAERAKHLGNSYDEVQGAEGLVVRVVSSVEKKLEVKPRFLEVFQEENYPKEFPYKSKAILLFQRIEGVEVCLFGMYVQEFGSECAFPNQRRVYLSYLDSVKYFRPDIKTVNGEALRTFVYHEILIGYLEYCKKRGFTSCYIWACPPLKGEDYILYCHPEIQKTPKSDKLREWYLSMLRKALKENIVVDLVNLYDHFFVPTGECKTKVTAARLPYFEGDYWPGAAEDMINLLRQEEDGRNRQKKGKTKNTISKRALKAAGQTDLSGNASKDIMLMQKLGDTILPMKEDFIMVHLQHCCNHCCILMVSGTRWVCHQCKNFQLCDKCYDVERRIDERERHPTHSREKHIFYPNEINDVPTDTNDQDEILESEFFDTRQAFLSLCQGNHYQYDTLRRAKHSSMMVLYHLHNPTAPAFVTTCNVCHNDIEAGKGWRCESCPEFDVCNACYLKGGIDHPHKLTNHPSMADHDAQNKEARQQRVLQLRKMLDLLVHASQCRFPHCQYPNCRKVKGLFRHGIQCRVRASGGCVLCKKMWLLLQIHARACKESECIVPRCRDLREHLRRLQQQSDSRRRAAVKEMMRQRAAEVSGNS